MQKIRVMLADDYPMIRAGIRGLLAPAEDIDIIGEASNGEEVVQLIGDLSPDLLVLDVRMPKMNGVEVVRRLKSNKVPVKILALSAYGEHEFILALFDAGIDGYLLKDEAPDTIIEAIRSIANGGQGWFSRKISAALTEYIKGSHLKKLSPREQEVLGLLVEGKTNQEIAYILRISQSTVEKCIYNIYEKLGVTSRVEAAVYAVREKLI